MYVVRKPYYSSKRRAIMARGEEIDHLTVFERDDWMCHICHNKIDSKLRGDAWMRATIDHVIPLCKGGEHTYDNVRASHWRCNMIKGGTILPG